MKSELIIATVLFLLPASIFAQSFESEVSSFIEESCLHCHESDTVTRLNFDELGHDLGDPDTFWMWENIYDRVLEGEMPPESEPRPDTNEMQAALKALATDLQSTSQAFQRNNGRVVSRRLTRLEHDYTLRDILGVANEFAAALPEENNSGGFDTVGASQGISPIHIRSYLAVADQALDAAIRLDRIPPREPVHIDYANEPNVTRWYELPLENGGQVIKKLDDAVGLLLDLDYIMRSDTTGFHIHFPGMYRIRTEAYAFNSESPLTLKIIQASDKDGEAKLVDAFDLMPDETRTVEVTTFMEPGDYFYPSISNEGGKNTIYGRNFFFRWTGKLHGAGHWHQISAGRRAACRTMASRKYQTTPRGPRIQANAARLAFGRVEQGRD